MKTANRVFLNTGILYAKMLITVGATLYSTRLVLESLGASDYGIYNLVAGVIAMLSFLNIAMTVSTQRYLSFHQGSGNFEMQKKIFVNSWILHIGIGMGVVLILLALVPLLFEGFLNIPIERISTAKGLYYFMVISVFFTIISVPFTASLSAHENMLWIAIVNIIEAFSKLGIAISLFWFIQSDRLIIYGILMAILSLLSFCLYGVYCLKKYPECRYEKNQADKSIIKELGSFAGWNLFGTLAGVSRSQGLSIILNIFLGTTVNAAYGIANQVAAQSGFFSYTMLKAITPQIMKSEGMNDRDRMLRLTMIASKFGFFLVAIIAIPVIFEMPAILKWWLTDVPEYTVIFCTLCLISILANQLTIGLQFAIQATGRIKVYQIIIGGMMLLTLPIGYLLLKFGLAPYFVLISSIAIEIACCFFRVFFLHKKGGMSISDYLKKVILKEIIPLVAIITTCWLITHFIHMEYRFVITTLISAIVFIISIYLFGLCADEKELINNMLSRFIKKRK